MLCSNVQSPSLILCAHIGVALTQKWHSGLLSLPWTGSLPLYCIHGNHRWLALQVMRLAAAAGAIKVAMLAVSGAFHTPLMQPARDALVQVHSKAAHVRLACAGAVPVLSAHVLPAKYCV